MIWMIIDVNNWKLKHPRCVAHFLVFCLSSLIQLCWGWCLSGLPHYTVYVPWQFETNVYSTLHGCVRHQDGVLGGFSEPWKHWNVLESNIWTHVEKPLLAQINSLILKKKKHTPFTLLWTSPNGQHGDHFCLPLYKEYINCSIRSLITLF